MTSNAKLMSPYLYNYNFFFKSVLCVSNMHLWYCEDITALRYWSDDDVALDDIKAFRAVEIRLHIVLPAVLDEGEWSASSPGHFIPREQPPYPLVKRPIESSACLWHVGKEKNLLLFPGIEPRFFGLPAPSLVASSFGFFFVWLFCVS